MERDGCADRDDAAANERRRALPSRAVSRQPSVNELAPERVSADSVDAWRRAGSCDDGSIGPYSLWSGTRTTPDGEFENLSPVANLNAMFTSDIEPWISADGHSLYFASDRIGTFDLWFATR